MKWGQKELIAEMNNGQILSLYYETVTTALPSLSVAVIKNRRGSVDSIVRRA